MNPQLSYNLFMYLPNRKANRHRQLLGRLALLFGRGDRRGKADAWLRQRAVVFRFAPHGAALRLHHTAFIPCAKRFRYGGGAHNGHPLILSRLGNVEIFFTFMFKQAFNKMTQLGNESLVVSLSSLARPLQTNFTGATVCSFCYMALS